MSAQQLFDESRGYADGWVQSADDLVRGFEHDLNVLRSEGNSAQNSLYDRLLSPEAVGQLSLADDYNVTQRLQTQIDKSSNLLEAEGIGDVDFEPTPLWDSARLPDPVVFDADAFKVPEFNGNAPTVDFGSAPSALAGSAPARPAGFLPVAIPSNFDIDVPSPPEISESINLPDGISLQEHQYDHAPPLLRDARAVVDAPDLAYRTIDINAPEYAQAIVIPTQPKLIDSFTIPAAPVLMGPITLPDAPTITFPAYLTNVDWGVVDDVGEANFRFAFNDEAYQSAMLDEVKAKLMSDLVGGGYGIEAGDEAGLWERARDREAASSGAEVQALARDFASRGFIIPPGAMFGALEGIRAKALDAAATLSRDVALKRADLYVQNRQFTIQQIQALETTLINQHMAVMERVLKAAQVSAQFVVDQYRARLDKARLHVDVIQARVQSFRELVAAEMSKISVYEAQIKAEVVKIDLDKNKISSYVALIGAESARADFDKTKIQNYAALISAESAKISANTQAVENYKARIAAELSKLDADKVSIDLYRAMIDAEQAKDAIDKNKIENYSALIRAESMKVEIDRAKIDLYNSQIRGELAKTEVDKNKLEAYRTQLAGVESTVAVYRLQVQAAEAAVQAERSKVEMWKAEVDGYLATVKAKESEFSGYESRIRGEQAKVQAFGEQVKAHAAIVDAKRVEADIKNLEVRSYAESASIALRVFEAELAANKSANDLLSRADENAVRALGAKVNAYQVGVSAAGKLADTNLDQSRLMLQSKLDASKIMLQSMIASIDTGLKYTTMEFDSKQKMVDMYKDMITAALGGLNSIASISE